MLSEISASFLQDFKRAVEEGKEVLDKRSGVEPSTQHNPLDFLEGWPSDESEDEGGSALPFTKPPDEETVSLCTASDALRWLRTIAQGLPATLEVELPHSILLSYLL